MSISLQPILPVLEQAVRLAQTQDDETEPYKSRYAAAEVLDAARKQLGTEEELQVAVLEAKRGCILLETDLLHDGELALLGALPVLEKCPGACPQLLQESYNALAVLHSSREQLEQAVGCLAQAEQLFTSASSALAADDGSCAGAAAAKRGPANAPVEDAAGCRAHALASSASPAQAAAAAAAGVKAVAASRVLHPWPSEALYAQTLLLLAQVHGLAGQKQLSASYCAATLNRQLLACSYQLSEWVQNCLQLSGYYLSQHDFASAEYCVLAAQALAQQQQHQQQLQQQQHQQHQQQHQQQHDIIQQDQGAQQPVRSGPLDEDVAANIEIAAGKLYAQRLAASHKVHVEQQQLEPPLCEGVSQAAQHLSFPSLAIQPLAQLPHGSAALVSSFEQARGLFNAGLARLKAALGYYRLDGWVSEHVALLMDVSNLYRCLAGFERDAHRASVMHRQRAKLLEPLVGQLSRDHYLGLVRSISLELGHVHRRIAEVKEAGGREPDKVCAAARQADRHYEAFLASFRSAEGQLPGGRVEPENESHYLAACFSIGRMACKLDPSKPSDADRLQAAHSYLKHGVEYVRRHQVAERQQEAQLAEQLAGLMLERLRLASQAAAAVHKQQDRSGTNSWLRT